MMKFIDRSHLRDDWPFTTPPPLHCYVDEGNQWTVQVFRVPELDGTPWCGARRVGIKRFQVPGDPESGGTDRMSWDDLQEVKDSLWPDQVAFEVYPPHDQIVDVATMRWLWVLPVGVGNPFELRAGHLMVDTPGRFVK